MHARIAGTGSYLPKKVLTNADLEKMVDTTDEWIRTRTGVLRRHLAAADETTATMSIEAARRAMAMAGVGPAEVDFIAVGTTTPDLVFPNSASTTARHSASRPRAAASSTRCRSLTSTCGRARRSARWSSAPSA
jgi:3-oxoacyl-[acyl-carrier-protein] synthase III